MESYRIEWKNSAEKDIRNIDKRHIPRIVTTIESLVDNPFPLHHRKLHGGESSYRIRVGNYRIIYQVDKKKMRVLIYHIRHRQEAYKK